MQIDLGLAPEPAWRTLSVVDLFSGVGGLSIGFVRSGFLVTGVDKEPAAEGVFRLQGVPFQRLDLSSEQYAGPADVVVGGPPCRPWSSVNVVRRRSDHEDHALLERFFEHVAVLSPQAFLMENVPPVAGDPLYAELLRGLEYSGYTIANEILRYSDYGAASARRRLFTVGFKDSVRYSAAEFFQRLTERRREASTVREAIDWLRDRPRGDPSDHEWSRLKSIQNYAERYKTGQFGWRQLGWDQPAPSFGSVSKTYILHPSSGEGDNPVRVLSVQEVLSIMGFDRTFHFPPGTALSLRYRMAANTVSPLVSEACAETLASMLPHVRRPPDTSS